MSKKKEVKLNWFQRLLKWFMPPEEKIIIADYQEIVDPGRQIIEALKAYEDHYRNVAVEENSKVLSHLNQREAAKREADRAMKAMKAVGSVFGKT